MEAAARVCLPEPSLCSPRAPFCRRPDAREAGGWLVPGAASSRPRAAQTERGLGPAGPTAPHPPPLPLPLPPFLSLPPARPCGVSGYRELGRVGLPAWALLAQPWPWRGGVRPGDPRAEPTPRTRAGQQPDSAPAPRRAAPAQCGRVPNPGTAGTKLPHHPRAQGSSMPRAGQGERWGRGPLIPAPPPAPSLGLGLARGLGPRAQAGVGRCVRAGQGTRAGGPEGPRLTLRMLQFSAPRQMAL